MAEDQSTAVVTREEAAKALGAPLPPMDDGEFGALWRTAKGLAESGLFKDATQAGQAFAKILAGRDLGLTPFEAMSGLHVIEGKIEASSDLHATKVQQADGYTYDVYWIKANDGGRAYADQEVIPVEAREAVKAADMSPMDLRPTVGCAIQFFGPDGPRGVSTWTIEDTLRANLQRDRGSKVSNHKLFPRSMYFARSMTNGVAWYIPEVMGGVRVYGHGEIQTDTGEDFTAGSADGEAVDMDALPTEVEAVIARAKQLGHVGLSNRETAARTVAAGPDAVRRWLRLATSSLNRMSKGEPEPEEAVVVERPAQTAKAPETPASEGKPADAPESGQDVGEAATVVAEPNTEDLTDLLEQWKAELAAAGVDADRSQRAQEAIKGITAQIAKLDENQGTLGV